jgi:hypothetical protein
MREADRKAFLIAKCILPIAMVAAILGKPGWFFGAIGCWGVGTGFVLIADYKELRKEG